MKGTEDSKMIILKALKCVTQRNSLCPDTSNTHTCLTSQTNVRQSYCTNLFSHRSGVVSPTLAELYLSC